MPASTATVTINVKDILGVDYSGRRTPITVRTNIDDETIVEKSSGNLRVGTGRVTMDESSGVATVEVWVPGADTNPASWQTYFDLEYEDRAARAKKRKTYGPFTITGDVDLGDLIEEQAVPPTYLSQVTQQLDAKVAEAEAAATQARDISNIDTPDSLVATLVSDSGSATGSALNASIEAEVAPIASGLAATQRRTVYGPRWVFDGDSITIGSIIGAPGTSDQNRGRSWTTQMVRASLGRIEMVLNAAVAGQRLDHALGRFDAQIAPLLPDVVFLTAMTNDIGQILGGLPRTKAEAFADLNAYLAKCRAINAELVVGAIWPSTDSPAGRRAMTLDWNHTLYLWGAANDVQVVGWDRLADPATGAWPTGWSSDGLHPGLLDSYAQIGAFGWAAVANRTGPAYVRRASYSGADLLSNGLNTAVSAVIGVPNPSVAGDTTSGTLPAGTYSYRVTTRNYYGEGLPSVADDVTLAGAGKATLTLPVVSGNRGYRIYRKGPGDTDYRYLATAPQNAAQSTYVDDGSTTPSTTALLTGVDSSAVPVGLNIGTPNLHAINGPILFPEAGVRGNVLRLRNYESGAGATDYYTANVTPGDVLEFSGLVRGSGAAADARVALRVRSGSGEIATVDAVQDALPTTFGLAHVRFTVPTGATTVRVSFESAAGSGYVDVAELRLAKVA